MDDFLGQNRRQDFALIFIYVYRHAVKDKQIKLNTITITYLHIDLPYDAKGWRDPHNSLNIICASPRSRISWCKGCKNFHSSHPAPSSNIHGYTAPQHHNTHFPWLDSDAITSHTHSVSCVIFRFPGNHARKFHRPQGIMFVPSLEFSLALVGQTWNLSKNLHCRNFRPKLFS